MKKKLFSALLALCLVITLLPFGAAAAEDFSPFRKTIEQAVQESSQTVYGTFFDFTGDGQSELILLCPDRGWLFPRVAVYAYVPVDPADFDGETTYCYDMLECDFDGTEGGESDYLAAILQFETGEYGLLLHTEGVSTSENPDYQGLIDEYVYDEIYEYRDGLFQRIHDSESVFWHTVPDQNGNVYYNPDQCWATVNGRDYTPEEFDAWYESFADSLNPIAWLSPFEELDGFTGQELLSLIDTGFYDVPAKAYYAAPVQWAAGKGITNGTDAYAFSPEDSCTRGQVVTFLWRAAGSPEPNSSKNPFSDVKSDAYYYKAVLWAVEQGVTKGTSETKFSPNAPCTRGQVVTFLHRNAKSPAVSAKNPFTDVKSGAYYYDAVLWAVKNGITNGTSASAFSPEQTCTRGQIVTFLHRDLAQGETAR